MITGLGAGLFYSNDRSLIAEQSPFEKRSLGMGFVITGLAIGITLALLLAAPLIDLGTSVFGAEDAWRMPFLVLGAVRRADRPRDGALLPQPGRRARRSAPPTCRPPGGWSPYAAVFFIAVMAIYMIATEAGLSEWVVALLELGLALALVALRVRPHERRGRRGRCSTAT